MRAYLQQVFYRIQGSYWFVPSLMVLAAIVLSQLTIWIDRMVGSAWLQDFWFTSLNQPDGARAILATVAGSMITVAGVTFSLTILAVSHASSHFGPRLLDNFMRDRGNQVTLGTFLATFLYCLLVLRVVRGDGSSGVDGLEIGVFVPQLSLLTAFVLTIASVAELIYFIHHVSDSIHISTVLQRLANDMEAKLDELYPETIGEPPKQDPGLGVNETTVSEIDFKHTVTSDRSGYLQGIDDQDLIKYACQDETVVRLLRRPGDFVRVHEPIAQVASVDDWNDQSTKQIRFGFTIGFSRTPTQDVFFYLNRFVEVAVRALSPGVNDPFTAMQCIDQLTVGLVTLSKRPLPSAYRTDPQGDLRIITTQITLADFVDSMLGQLVPYVVDDANVKRYFIKSLEKVIEISHSDEMNRLLEEQLDAVRTTPAPKN